MSKAQALLDKLQARIAAAPSSRPALSAVPDPGWMDPISREAHCKRIRYLARAYGLRWLLDQETFHVAALECLDDDALSALLRDMERGRECLRDDVSFEDAGLVRARA